MGKSSDHRVNKIALVKRGKFSNQALKTLMKYETKHEDALYILSKLSKNYTKIIFNNPLPDCDEAICKEEAILNPDSKLIEELFWAINTCSHYSKEINKFLLYNKDIESKIVNNEFDEAFDILNKVDEEISHSVHAIKTEMLINELLNISNANEEILKEISDNDPNIKFFYTLQLDRFKMKRKFSYWQYDALLEVEKQSYNKDPKFMDYITFKYDPIWQNLEEELNNIPFIINFESDFPIIDRYLSIKKIIPLILSQNELNDEEKIKFINKIREITNIFNDSYWSKLILFISDQNTDCDIREEPYYEIQKLYFTENYEELIFKSLNFFKKDSSYSCIYLFFVKSVILLNKDLNDYFAENTQLKIILDLIKKILEKGKNYINERENLLKLYYSFSHLSFSQPILEFILYEYNLNMPQKTIFASTLSIDPVRYNFFESTSLLQDRSILINSIANSNVRNHLKEISEFNTSNTLFAKQLFISNLINNDDYHDALLELNAFVIQNKDKIRYDFIDTWLNKKYLKCYFELKNYSAYVDLIVDSYFKKGFAYDHYFEEDIVDLILDIDETNVHKNISIPILFEIYNQQQSVLYDALANFLVANNVKRPKELCEINLEFTQDKIIHFYEKICTKENIEDSPYINTIEEVESERIVILNYLKTINSQKTNEYNEEILKITKESSIRKGLLQIHESRIYVDTNNIFKIADTNLKEIFERYLDLTNTDVIDFSTVKLNEPFLKEKINLSYYFLEPIDIEYLPFYDITVNPLEDPNAVIVPQMRFIYFTTLFNSIKQLFVFDESYGFKVFLSMRIRHGTFSNVLRSVFDKHKIVSSLEANSYEYKNVKFWEEKFDQIDEEEHRKLQLLFKDFSRKIDKIIEEGLLWINVYSKDSIDPSSINAVFDFEFQTYEIKILFINRMGRITDFTQFVNEVFQILYEKLESNLIILRNKISLELTPNLVQEIDLLTENIQNLSIEENIKKTIENDILNCRTDIQIITSDINNWFKVSYNKSIEEFPIDMILQSSLNYIDIINTNAITKGNVVIVNNCHSRFNGEFFESFGDIFINLFDNIISKNRELDSLLKIEILIEENNDEITIIVKNNLAKSTSIENLAIAIDEIKLKVKNYVDDSPVGFEKGSGYLKICKCIATGLNRKNYLILPSFDDSSFEVKIEFNIKDLIV